MENETNVGGDVFGLDFGGEDACTYTGKCECGRVIDVSTQHDHNAEYITTVYIRCVCGKSVKFELPVN